MRLVLAATTVLALAACSHQAKVAPAAKPAPPPSASPSPSPSPHPTYPTSYKDADTIWEILDDTDTLGCGDPTPIASPIAATSLIDCGPHVVIAVYPDRKTTDAAFDRVHGRYPHDPLLACVGGNWMVTGAWPLWVHQICDLLGGRYREAPGTSPTP